MKAIGIELVYEERVAHTNNSVSTDDNLFWCLIPKQGHKMIGSSKH